MSKPLIIKLIICLLVMLLVFSIVVGVILFNQSRNLKNSNTGKKITSSSSSSNKTTKSVIEVAVVPNLLGKTRTEATTLLTDNSLRYIIAITSDASRPDGIVLNQYYKADTTVPEKTAILIVLNRHSEKVEIVEEKPPREPIYYNGFVVVGYIEIPKINLSYPVLESGSDISLEASVGVMYPPNPVLNAPGNVIVMGHNYRNGKFFSNVNKLSIGDTVIIEDLDGKKLTYTIYDMYEVTPEEVSYITRETNGGTEITLYTCTDDGARRLIALAKVL